MQQITVLTGKYTARRSNGTKVLTLALSFTLFLTKNLPLYEQVYNSAGGLLGIGNVPNVVMFAYSATFNEFYVCEW